MEKLKVFFVQEDEHSTIVRSNNNVRKRSEIIVEGKNEERVIKGIGVVEGDTMNFEVVFSQGNHRDSVEVVEVEKTNNTIAIGEILRNYFRDDVY